MNSTLRPCWNNCASEPDEEIMAIDTMEDSIAPLDEETTKTRRLITSLQLCHHKAERHVEVIIEAIEKGSTSRGPGTRPRGQRLPVEQIWQRCAAVLSAWCAGCPAQTIDLNVGGVPASQLISLIGERTPLKEWQVQRIVDKVSEYVVWSQAYREPSLRYVEMVEYGEHYREHSEFRDLTMRTIIHDTVDGRDAEINLARAIDHLQPCNWNFVRNLIIVLGAIGGDLYPKTPFAAHSRNIKVVPIRDKMRIVSDTLGAFCERRKVLQEVDEDILGVLGAKTPVKQWLSASLDKTIRLQLDL